MNTQQLFSFSFFSLPQDICRIPTEGWQGWWRPLLRRVDYLMKGNQLERYGGLWTFIHLAWPLLNFHDRLWLFRGRDQSWWQLFCSPPNVLSSLFNEGHFIKPGGTLQPIDGYALCGVWRKKMRHGRGWVWAEGRMESRMVFGVGVGTSQMSSSLKEN